jgi:15-cis-phytoene synthase
VSTRALDAAGIREPDLREAYDACRRAQAGRGGAAVLATGLLPEAKRPFVWALEGFVRQARDLVGGDGGPEALREWGSGLLAALSGGEAPAEPVARATVNTLRRWQIPRTQVETHLEALRAHAGASGYRSYGDLERWLAGGGGAPALLLLPVLEPLSPEAAPRARALGEALQLTGVVLDLHADLRAGRLWLPAEDLADFGLTVADLRAGVVTPAVRELLRFELARARRLAAFAEPGIEMLHRTSRDAVRTVFDLAVRSLDEIERTGFRVLTQPVRVPLRGRLAVRVPRVRHARSVRRDEGRWVPSGS